MDKLSIVIPVYNEENTVLSIVRKVKAVEIPLHKEILIVDDCSTDSTRKQLEKLAGDADVRVNRVELTFLDQAGNRLDATTVNQRIAQLGIFREANGDGLFDPAADYPVAVLDQFALDANGVLSIQLPIDPVLGERVPYGAQGTYYVGVVLGGECSDQGAPFYDHQNARRFAELGIPTFACTPDLFPELMAAAIQRQDLNSWAAKNEIAVARGEDEDA